MFYYLYLSQILLVVATSFLKEDLYYFKRNIVVESNLYFKLINKGRGRNVSLRRFRLIDKYIFKQTLKPYLIGVTIITIIMLSNFLFQMTDLIIVKKIPVIKVVQLLLYQLPDIVVQTFPMAVLFATMTGLGRLSRENEFTALRMGGISIYRLIIPLIIFGLLVSGFTYYLNEEVVPWSNHQANNIIRRSILREASPDIKEDVFFEGPKDRLFYVREYKREKNILKNIVIYNMSSKNDFPQIITATEGYIGNDKIWELKDGFIHKYDDEGHLNIETQFDLMEVEIARDVQNFFGEQRTPSEMSREELKKEIDLFKDSGISVNSLLVEYHLKLAMPFTPFIFVLIGAPLSLGNKESRALNIILTIVTIFAYYLILSLSRSFGKNGMLHPIVAAWIPNASFTFFGVILLIYQESWQNFVTNFIPRIFK